MKKLNSVSIVLTEKCNMSCKFCYEKNQSSKTMSLDTLINTIDFLNQLRNEDKFNIMWFGGEPLLVPDLMKKGIEYTKKTMGNMVSHLVSTNGTHWNENIRQIFLDNPKLKLQVSWMGLPEFQDSERGQSELVEKNIKRIVNEIPNDLQFQIQAIPKNIPKLEESIEYMVNIIGNRGIIYLRPVLEDPGWTAELIKEFERKFTNILSKYSRRFKKFPEAKKGLLASDIYCHLGKGFVSVTPDGDIYTCHRLIFHRDNIFKMGDVNTGFTESNSVIDFLKSDEHTRDSTKCSNCSAYNYCYICPASHYGETGNLFEPTKQMCDVNKAVANAFRMQIQNEILLESY